MNQILSVETNKKQKNKAPVQIEIKKIIIFFAIILLVFGLVIGGKSIWDIVSNKSTEASAPKVDEPNITTSKQDGKITIEIQHNKEITKMEYNWNNATDKEVPGDGSNYLETTIEAPSGNNILNIITTDIEGKQSTYSKEFLADPNEPQVTLEEAGSKIKIKAKDNEELSLITYRWDDEEETEIEIPENSSAQVEEEIDIRLGNHTLTVIVVNSKNMKVTKTQEIKVLKEPKADIQPDPTDKTRIILTAVDETFLIDEMRFWINGENGYKAEYSVPATIPDYVKDDGAKIEVIWQLEPGENNIKVKAINKEGLESIKELRYYCP